LPIFVKVCTPWSGPDRIPGVRKHMRKFLIALSIATITFAVTAANVLAAPLGGSGPCCYS